ncbi:MAG: dipeptidase [Desulfonatronovibrionaceae bacterium]
MKILPSLLISSLILVFCSGPVHSCTTTIVGKKASKDGSVMVSHSDDGLGDARLIHVPAMDHEPGSRRTVYYTPCSLGYKEKWNKSRTQRLITDTRGPGYKNPDLPQSKPLGYIPQVRHTYAYFDANYGLMNEHQLSIGECTDKAKVHPEPEAGKRIFYSTELSHVALERCTTAREAVRLMGDLIREYGYYGTGETLLVADPDEAWVMEMCGYDPNGDSGVWVAKRVPDEHFFVAANQFRIREVKKGTADMMYSENIFDVARDKRWWDPEKGPLDWARVYGDGEFHHPYYSLRRVWRAQSLVAPSLDLSAWVEGPFTKEYPFSIKPDEKLGVKDLFRIHRDNYQGTEFDMTKGLAAGAFGNPNRFEGGAESIANREGQLSEVKGAFERPLNIYRCVYAYVNQSRAWLPDPIGGRVWFGPDRPATSVLMPFYCGAQDLPASIQKADILKYDPGSMWTAFNYVANYAMLKYQYMIEDIRKLGSEFEDRSFEETKQLEEKALRKWQHGDKNQAREMLTQYADRHAEEVLSAWNQLAKDLYIKYNDGYINDRNGIGQAVFYPAWWLKEVGYESGPTAYEKQDQD